MWWGDSIPFRLWTTQKHHGVRKFKLLVAQKQGKTDPEASSGECILQRHKVSEAQLPHTSSSLMPLLYCFVFETKILLCNPGWPQTSNSASPVQGTHVYTTISRYYAPTPNSLFNYKLINGFNPLLKVAPSWSNHLSTVAPSRTNPSIPETSYPNRNKLQISHLDHTSHTCSALCVHAVALECHTCVMQSNMNKHTRNCSLKWKGAWMSSSSFIQFSNLKLNVAFSQHSHPLPIPPPD